MASTIQTPGVYINEVNAFPNSVVPVATAVPVFIGYTMRADYKDKSYLNKAVQIESLLDFLTFYGVVAGSPPAPAPDQQQYAPIYHAVPSQGDGDMIFGGNKIDLLPDPSTIYYLYNSIKLFYQNGGATAFVVSVGLIGQSSSARNSATHGSRHSGVSGAGPHGTDADRRYSSRRELVRPLARSISISAMRSPPAVPRTIWPLSAI